MPLISKSVFALTAVGALVGSSCSDPTADAGRTKATIQGAVSSQLAVSDAVRVFINLRVPLAFDAPDEERRSAIRSAQDRVLVALDKTFVPTRRFSSVPAVAGELTRAGLELAAAHDDVMAIQIDNRVSVQLAESVPLVGADVARTQYGWTGRGVTVAFLDSGVDTTHPDLSDSLVAQHCFTQGGGCSGQNEGTKAEDDNGHGTNVAGIVTSNGKVSSIGFAPDSSIVMVKVLKSDGTGQTSDWVAGLDWIYNNLATRPVDIVSMSLASSALYNSICDSDESAAAAAVRQLIAKGVAVFAASGNNGSSTSLAAPACITGVVAVGATFDGNVGRQPPSGMWTLAQCFDSTSSSTKIVCFTNSNARLDVLAPGCVTTSTGMGGKTSAFSGTSQATPAAAGVGALLKQCNPSLSPDAMRTILKQTGSPITDSRNNRMIPAVKAVAAIQKACGNDGGLVSDSGVDGAAGSDGGSRDVGGMETAGAGGAGGAAGTTGNGGAAGVGGIDGGAGSAGAGGTSSGGAAGRAGGGAAGSTGGSSGSGGVGGVRDGGGFAGTTGSGGSGTGPTGGTGAGGSAAGGSGGGSTGGAAGNAHAASADNQGCGCHLAAAPAKSAPSAVGLVLGLLASLSVRRSRRSSTG